MRYLLAMALSAILANLSAHSLYAQEPVVGEPVVESAPGQVLTVELIEAHQQYQLAKLRQHEYRFVTLPRVRRQLDDQIKATAAEIAVFQRRLRDYRPFLQVGHNSPVRTAVESHYLALVGAQQRLTQLRDERSGLNRLTRQNNQLYQLEVLKAATRLALARKAVEQP
ncbi:MAG: hypothetical protein KDA57_16370 [Planctomycetales bacterium]|nr:hypothetical protein [Planctomycetales bacterium]